MRRIDPAERRARLARRRFRTPLEQELMAQASEAGDQLAGPSGAADPSGGASGPPGGVAPGGVARAASRSRR
jgi:hypothetical protein